VTDGEPGGGGPISRRRAIAGAAAVAGGLASGGCSRDGSADRARQQTDALSARPPARALVAAYDLDVSGRTAVGAALEKVAERAAAAPSGTEVVVGLGASLFDRAGITEQRPRQLTAMPSFPGDVLDPARTHGDLLIHVGAAGSSAAKRLLDDVASALSARWQVAGFRSGTGTSGGRPTATNLFGFTEGHGNPDHAHLAPATLIAAGEPEWAAGGTYAVVRTIRFATALWNLDPVPDQERIMGRHRDGRWLDGRAATAEPAFAGDPDGKTTPLDSHVRLANPRDGNPRPQLLRRGFSYRAGTEEGLLFMAYQRDLELGFAGVQKRLATEKLARYVLPVGGGYFFVPPPARDDSWWGAPLFP
jgi:deferrochelatase/peroxidase EfeB